MVVIILPTVSHPGMYDTNINMSVNIISALNNVISIIKIVTIAFVNKLFKRGDKGDFFFICDTTLVGFFLFLNGIL